VQVESVMGLYLERLPRQKPYKSLQMFQNVAAHQFAGISRIARARDRKLRAWIHGEMMRRWEPRYAEKLGRCTTVPETDRQLLLRANPRLRVEVIPNGVDVVKYHPVPPPADNAASSLMFIGSMGYPPCVDAVLYF
jgi:glycosyltransferase involved in cell wall biosynthesis